ncbi:hypothetical protein EJ04DRAFT_514373 [Polyplosphaeria fusca]|uniref:Uncharacterized protein n=1 Tax=Polyplosphaeria fusca TaxID=682080 RepID=A0A9P4QSL3_9PLEO|nr:hypothetical protein EJ04DRAFT_514373 [Polyplosphaeria fusca]
MENWGDPWADHVDNQPPPKIDDEVKTPPLPVQRAPVVLNGFLDDAGWGNAGQEDGSMAWAPSSVPPSDHATTSVTRVPDPSTTNDDELPNETGHTLKKQSGMFEWNNEGWGDIEQGHEISLTDVVVSESSESTTTVQPDDAGANESPALDASVHDDDFSTRPSTSPSDISHNERLVESPRTSFEDERVVGEGRGPSSETKQQDDSQPLDTGAYPSPEATVKKAPLDEDDFGNFENDHADDSHSECDTASKADSAVNVRAPAKSETTSGSAVAPIARGAPLTTGLAVPLDQSLIDQLFPASKPTADLAEALEDPIHSTSARKAWYRLTRKQTLREFNNGGNDDNYVRINWANSQVRKDVAKIVGRWSSEDRVSGRGHGPGGMFNWDRAGSGPDPTALHTHLRKKSAMAANLTKSAMQTVQPLSTEVPAAFTWSTPTATTGPWKEDGGRSVSSPVTVKHDAASKIQGQHARTASAELTKEIPAKIVHSSSTSNWGFEEVDIPASLAPTGPASNVSTFVSPPPTASAPSSSSSRHEAAASSSMNLWNDSDVPGSTATVGSQTPPLASTEYEWGEMIGSPTAPSPPSPSQASSPPSSVVQTPVRTIPVAASTETPASINSSPFGPLGPSPSAQAAAAKGSNPLVRLRGTVSPTSSNFKFNSFVPESVEQGPVGPGLLKKRTDSKSPSRTLKTNTDVAINAESLGGSLGGVDDEMPASESPISKPTTAEANPVSQEIATTPSDLDFSIFESGPPAALPHAEPAHKSLDPTDPWSIFDTPAPPPQPEPTPFVRPPARSATPPSMQPLTGATNAAQRRKVEEDEIIQNILSGLPDLAYMLRR